MNDFQGLLSADYGFKPQGKAAPMVSQKSTSNFSSTSSKTSSFHSASSLIFDDDDTLFRPDRKTSIDDFSGLGDVFSNKLEKSFSTSSKIPDNVDFDSIFGDGGGDSLPKFSSLPVFDKPVFDDEVSSSDKYEDVFSSTSGKERGDAFDDLLGGLGKKESQSVRNGGSKSSILSFDDLLPGFGNGSSINRTSSEFSKKTKSQSDDPFVILESTLPPTSSSPGILQDPLEEISNLNKKNTENSSGVLYDDIDPLSGLSNSIPSFSPDINGEKKDSNPFVEEARISKSQTSSVRSPERVSDTKIPADGYSEVNASFKESNSHGHGSPSSEDVIWLTVSEVPLSTQPTVSPPPSRPPPPRPENLSRAEYKVNEFSYFPSSVPDFHNPQSVPSGVKGSFSSPLDELEEFAMGRNQSEEDRSSDLRSSQDFDSNSVAEAMKEAMERAEAKFRHAKGVRERENAKAFKNRDSIQVEKDEKPMYDAPPEREFRGHQERLEREQQQQQKEREEEEKRRREEEEREREKRRVERERQAVERAAIEARARAERVAVQRAQAEARERAERAAVQRAQAEARERAQAGAKERAEKAALEVREKAKAEAREREVREREAREREASERAASEGRVNQQRNDNDLESFFSMGSRASSAPRPRATSSDPFGTDQFQSKPAPNASKTSVNSSSNMRKASSSTNIVDDLSSIFGGPPSSNDFPEFEEETEDRRKARMERHQRTQERAAKALAEKNARDLEAQREQAERHRIAETLDVEIRRWAAGKEGNLRALLSTLQYVLWPECGWQPVSLTDLITGALVKKVYRKATLCIHPDKVQQKGATLQQKYVAEKVFDLLKEAWNKFNSEELF